MHTGNFKFVRAFPVSQNCTKFREFAARSGAIPIEDKPKIVSYTISVSLVLTQALQLYKSFKINLCGGKSTNGFQTAS